MTEILFHFFAIFYATGFAATFSLQLKVGSIRIMIHDVNLALSEVVKMNLSKKTHPHWLRKISKNRCRVKIN